MAANAIAIGPKGSPILVLDNDNIVRADIRKAFDPVGSELQVGTIEIVCSTKGFVEEFLPSDYPDGMQSADGSTVYCLENDSSEILNFRYGTEIRPSLDGFPLGLFYVKDVKQTGKNEYTITGQDYAGVLSDFNTFGFNAINITLVDAILYAVSDRWPRATAKRSTKILRDIFSRFQFQSTAVASIKLVDGYLGQCSCREGLQSVLMVTNTCILEQPNEKLLVSFVPATTGQDILASNTYSNGSVSTCDPVKNITVSITSLIPPDSSEPLEVIYDNTAYGTRDDLVYITSDGPPFYAVTLAQGDYHEFGHEGTYAYLWGKGKVLAKRYKEMRRTIVADNPTFTIANGSSINFDSTLTTNQTSSVVLNRLKSYYFANRSEVELSCVFDGETPGYKYRFLDPFDATNEGNLTQQDVSMSAITKASCRFMTGFTPYSDTPYVHSVVLTGSGEWAVPEGVNDFIVTLIGGGHGGSSGLRGADGKSSKATKHGLEQNPNGADGTPGIGGNIYTVTVTNPDSSYSYSCGTGGSGGAMCSDQKNSNDGYPGTDTFFGPYSSGMGAPNDEGFVNIFNGVKYGGILNRSTYDAMGDDYYRGSGGYYRPDGSNTWYTPAASAIVYDKYKNGARETYFVSGSGNPDPVRFDFSNDRVVGYAYWVPGTAGGSANGGDWNLNMGDPGQPAYWAVYNESVQCGNGGNGAHATAPGIYPMDVGNLYGYGGGPGYGGGAGGNAGFMNSDSYTNLSIAGQPGIGGNGGPGGNGAPGCIIIYY